MDPEHRVPKEAGYRANPFAVGAQPEGRGRVGGRDHTPAGTQSDGPAHPYWNPALSFHWFQRWRALPDPRSNWPISWFWPGQGPGENKRLLCRMKGRFGWHMRHRRTLTSGRAPGTWRRPLRYRCCCWRLRGPGGSVYRACGGGYAEVTWVGFLLYSSPGAGPGLFGPPESERSEVPGIGPRRTRGKNLIVRGFCFQVHLWGRVVHSALLFLPSPYVYPSAHRLPQFPRLRVGENSSGPAILYAPLAIQARIVAKFSNKNTGC